MAPQTLQYQVQELRQSPRFSYQLFIDIDGLEVATTNISLGGAQICCPKMRYDGFVHGERNGFYRMCLNVLGEALCVRAAVRYANLCDDEYLIGVEFIEFDECGKIAWDNFIALIADRRNTALN